MIVVLAFACEPGRGSEPGVGFEFVKAIAIIARDEGRRVVVMTRPHRVSKILDELVRHDLASFMEIHPVSVPRWAVVLTGRRRVRLAYLMWQWIAVNRVRRMLASTAEPAIVHHVTFATEALPAFEWRLRRRAALVFGPAGNAHVVDAQKLRLSNARLKLLRSVRVAASRSNVKHSDLLIANNFVAASAWAEKGQISLVEPNISVEPQLPLREIPAAAESAAVVWIGGFIRRKRPELALETIAALNDPGVTLTMVGGGDLRRELEEKARALGISERVVLTGALSRVDTLQMLQRHRVLLHTSSQEGSAWVVGEAQACGVVPVVVAKTGPDSVVRLAGIGVIAQDSSPVSLARAVEEAITTPRPHPSSRWSANRLPSLLGSWYRAVDEVAVARAPTKRSAPQ
jgi:glycosyltransferase involved in cell wall biosynthesis